MIPKPQSTTPTLSHGTMLRAPIAGADAAAGDRWLYPIWCWRIPAHVIAQKGCQAECQTCIISVVGLALGLPRAHRL